jgi:Domain of unknown function (DUF4326)
VPRVWNVHRPHPSGAVRVDRTTPYGNPFHIGRDGTREEVCDKYEFWIFQPEQLELRMMMLRLLRGKDLLCHCHPLECHADTILKIANAD